MADTHLIQSIVRSLDIMELLDAEGELGITEIAQKLGMEKSTVFRAVNTLKVRHYLNQHPDTLKYSNGYKLFEIGSNVVRNTGLPKMAIPFMRSLAQKVSGAVNLGIREGSQVVYLDKIESVETVKVCLKVGQRIPLHCTALGKSLLAYLPERDIRTIVGAEELDRYTELTLPTATALLAELKKVRKSGYSVDDEEHIPGIYCVAAPVFNAKREVIAALSVALPKISRNDADNLDEIGPVVCEAAEGFTQALGGRLPERKN